MVTVRAADVRSKGPVSASKVESERGEVSSDLPTGDEMGGEATCTGLDDTEGRNGIESTLGATGEND